MLSPLARRSATCTGCCAPRPAAAPRSAPITTAQTFRRPSPSTGTAVRGRSRPRPPASGKAVSYWRCPAPRRAGAPRWGVISGLEAAGVPLLEHSSAGTWRVQPIQAPSGTTDANLAGISCTAAACRTAVGDYPTGPGNARLYLPVAEYWDGSTWRLRATASPAGHKILGGISCTSAGSCTAVGWYRLSPYQTLAKQR